MSRLRRRGLPGPAPAGGPISCTGKKWGKEAARGEPLDPRAASGWPAAKVGDAMFTDERTSLQHPASRRAAGAMPLPASLRNRTRSTPGEARPLLFSSHVPQGGGKLRGFAAHARKARERSERALFSAVDYGELSGFGRWVRPQPELSLQLVYPWGAAVVRGSWQGTPVDT